MNNSSDAVVPVTYRRFLVDNLNNQLTSVNAQIQATKSSMPDLANLSTPAAEMYEARVNIALWESQLKAHQERLKSDKISAVEKEALKGKSDEIYFLHLNSYDSINSSLALERPVISVTCNKFAKYFIVFE